MKGFSTEKKFEFHLNRKSLRHQKQTMWSEQKQKLLQNVEQNCFFIFYAGGEVDLKSKLNEENSFSMVFAWESNAIWDGLREIVQFKYWSDNGKKI